MGFYVCVPTSDGSALEVLGVYAEYVTALADAASVREKAEPGSRASRVVIRSVESCTVCSSAEDEPFWLA